MTWSVGPRAISALSSQRLELRFSRSLAERQFSCGTGQELLLIFGFSSFATETGVNLLLLANS